MVHLTRRYRFSAAHRLHSEALTPEENTRIYGKCNNPHGHGHNYVLEVTVVGPVSAATGMVINLAILDRAVQQEIVEQFDHAYLNLDVESFRSRVPTTENLCVEAFDRLRKKLESEGLSSSGRLEKVRLEETRSNFFEYEGPEECSETGRKAR